MAINNTNGLNELAESDAASNSAKQLRQVDIAQIAIDSANAGIWLMNADTREFIPSNRTKELFGFTLDEEMSLRNAMEQVAQKYRDSVIAAFETAFKDHTNLYIEYPVTGYHDQKNRWLSVTGGFTNQDASNSYFSGIVMDITERKQNDLRKGKFIGIVSHELKTPLTTLKAYIQMLSSWAKKQKDNFSIGALSKVDKQVKKMLNMINSLLNLSSAEGGKIHINKQPFNLPKLINEVIEETLFITATHEIVLVPCEEVTIVADREKIEQVLVNLLSNAAKYSAKETTIEVACKQKGDAVEISVSDHGFGIAAEDIDKLFTAHYRVESKDTEKAGGFGIGLYLCSEIIKRHEGKIWAESTPGEGSTFKFALPIK
jgi:PAS domain S-box-containing protein